MSDCGCNCNECDKCNDIIQVTPACPCPEPTPPVQITSTGNSITVTHPGIINGKDTWNVEKECCADNKVSVDGADTPAFLEVQLAPSPDNAITWQKVDGPDGTKVMRPVLDQTKINDKNDKVAAAAGCTAGYLTETLTVSDSKYFGWNTAGCKTRLVTNPRKLLRARFRLKEEQTFSMTTGIDGFLWQEVDGGKLINIPSALKEEIIDIGEGKAYVVTIPTTGWYLITMQGSYTVTGLHTIRNQIWKKANGSRPGVPILDARDEGAWRVDQDNNDIINTQAELNKEIRAITNNETAILDGEEMSISYSMSGLGFGGSTPYYFTAGDEIMMGFKYNSRVKDTIRHDIGSHVTFTSEEFDQSTNGKGAGTGRGIVELPEFALTD